MLIVNRLIPTKKISTPIRPVKVKPPAKKTVSTLTMCKRCNSYMELVWNNILEKDELRCPIHGLSNLYDWSDNNINHHMHPDWNYFW